jgi:predicted phage replisome organizer/uncharacterized phage protein (TIGR02220 family)
MSEITWFKVLTDIFSDDKIKIIQSMPEGDSLLIMWFKVLSQAGKTNDGGYIYLKKEIPYTAGMLSTLFGKSQQLVELALKTFSQFGMIDIDDKGYIFVMNWEKHQSIEKMDKIREQTRIRVAEHRKKKQFELESCNVTVTQNVTQGNETDIDIEKEKRYIVPHSEIINYLNQKAGTNFKSTTKATKEHINARFREGFTLDQFKTVIDKKCAAWMNDDRMCKYLRPETLFGTKFESYLNEHIVITGGKNNSYPDIWADAWAEYGDTETG